MRSLIERVKLDGMEERFGEVLVPTEEVVEMRGGQKRKSERKFFPGYVLVQMVMNEPVYLAPGEGQRPRVMGFIGGTADRPAPITDKEADAILNRVADRRRQAPAEDAVRAGRDGSCHRWSVRRLQWCRRRS